MQGEAISGAAKTCFCFMDGSRVCPGFNHRHRVLALKAPPFPRLDSLAHPAAGGQRDVGSPRRLCTQRPTKPFGPAGSIRAPVWGIASLCSPWRHPQFWGVTGPHPLQQGSALNMPPSQPRNWACDPMGTDGLRGLPRGPEGTRTAEPPGGPVSAP